jgi:hypothetical protein
VSLKSHSVCQLLINAQPHNYLSKVFGGARARPGRLKATPGQLNLHCTLRSE